MTFSDWECQFCLRPLPVYECIHHACWDLRSQWSAINSCVLFFTVCLHYIWRTSCLQIGSDCKTFHNLISSTNLLWPNIIIIESESLCCEYWPLCTWVFIENQFIRLPTYCQLRTPRMPPVPNRTDPTRHRTSVPKTDSIGWIKIWANQWP